MEMHELEDHINIMLNQLRVPSKKLNIMKDTSVQFVVEDFGLIICCINRVDYAQANDAVHEKFNGWRVVYFTTQDDLVEKKYEVLWALMRCGYMKWLRYKFPRQVKNTLIGTENLGARIIKERLRIWNNQPKFSFLIEDNEIALRNGVQRELVNDPSFFDYMPEEGV